MRIPRAWLAGAGLTVCFLMPAAALAHPAADDLAAKAQRGKEAMAAGRFDEAAALYAEITRALPDEPGMLLNLGMALSMAGRPREAVPRLEAALKLRPDLLPASLFLGAARLELGQPARAVEPLQRVVAAQPENLEARRRLADALWSLERFEPAIEQYRTLSEQAPEDPRAWYGLAQSYEGVARVALERLQGSAPDSDYVLRLVADTMLAEGRLANAFRLYREALEKRPSLAEAHEALARIYEDSGHPEWAAVERERSRRVPLMDCHAPSLECDFRARRYASVLAAARRLGTAEGLYWESRSARELAAEAFARLDRLPPSAESTLRRVEVLRSRKRTQAREAIEELKKAAQAWPEDIRIRRELATMLVIVGDTETAQPILEDLLKREPESAEAALALGETWLKAQQPGKAIPILEGVVRRDPKLLSGQAALGRAYAASGDMAKAIAPLEAALETDTDGSLHYQLARAYRATGRPEQASQALARFEALRKTAEAERQGLQEEFQITPP
ncbi:MAG TPA: tetratricopeptide repeat protein [Vicinamibacteria bacterium]